MTEAPGLHAHLQLDERTALGSGEQPVGVVALFEALP